MTDTTPDVPADAWSGVHRGPLQPGQWVRLVDGKGRRHNFELEPGKRFFSNRGHLDHDDLIGRDEGFTKLIFDQKTHRVLGAGIVGTNAGDLIAEVALAIEMGCEAADIGLTIHPHPTLSESIGMAAEVYEGTITDLYIPKRK